MYGEYDDLASFDNNFTPQAMYRPGLDVLSDGDYDFTITDAVLDRAKNGQRILKLGLRTHLGGTVERTYWLTTQETMNRLGADLLLLGFPANTWGAGKKSLGTELPACVEKLPGIKFRGVKRAKPGSDGKTYHELYISGRISGAPMPPPVAGHPAKTDGAVPAAAAAGGGDDSNIPF